MLAGEKKKAATEKSEADFSVTDKSEENEKAKTGDDIPETAESAESNEAETPVPEAKTEAHDF